MGEKRDRLELLLDFLYRMKWWITVMILIALMAWLGILPTNSQEAKQWLDTVLGFLQNR